MSIISDPLRAIDLIQSKKLLVFDFDGVLADSVEVKTEAFAELYKPYGDRVAEMVVQHHRENGGMSRFEKFRHYHGTFLNKQIDEEGVGQLSKAFSKIVVDKVIASPEIPAAGSFLNQYCKPNIISIINSATPTDEIKRIAYERGISDIFDGIYGSPNSKADNLITMSKTLPIKLNEGIFFGDAESDFKAAQATGMDFIGIGKTMEKLLENVDGEWFVFDDFSELVDAN